MLFLILISGGIYVGIQLLLAIACHRSTPQHSLSPEELVPLSVIIAARNEAVNLARHLPEILSQEYPDFEVLVVLDRCSDLSLQLIRTLQKEYTNLAFVEITRLPEGWSGKKWAIQQGINTSKNEHLAFIDADCSPAEDWLISIGRHFGEKQELILGIGHYYREKSLLNAFIQFETIYTCFQYIGFAKLGQPYMGVGRNLAYKKSFFTDNGGFNGIESRLSGDDDLIVNKYAKADRTVCMLDPQSKTLSYPKSDFSSWIRQKLRHLGASPEYSVASKILLGIFHGSHFLFYTGIIFFLLLNQTFCLFWASYIGRIMISWLIFLGLRKKLQFESWLYLFPVLDLLYFIYNLSLVPIGYIQKRMAWS